MAYSINPNLSKARQQAVLLVVKDRVPVSIVARRFGVSRSTVYRWLKRWQEINEHRDGNWRKGIRGLNYYKFLIPTKSSRPHTSPNALPSEVIERTLDLRRQLKRCAEVVWHYLNLEGTKVSLSSVRRILARHHEYDRPKYDNKYYRKNIKRPPVTDLGDLVQTDTVHLLDPNYGTRKYIYTVIDLCSRMAYAKVSTRLSQLVAVETVLAAEQVFRTNYSLKNFRFRVVQADNGSEFGYLFKDRLKAHGMAVRHSRPYRSNDNAHVERFNRTLRHECIGQYMSGHYSTGQVQSKLNAWLDYYNTERVHLSLQCQTPLQFARRVLRRW
jgi:transposase InsO family protein